MLSTFRSFKALVALAAVAATALLAGCGGGGAKDPFDPGPSAPPLVLAPGSLNVYSNIPAVVTVTSGVAPFRVFSSDSVVLPVAPSVSGTLITLVPANVNVDTPVTLTVEDNLGRRVAVAVTVKPATLVNQAQITPISNTRCGSPDTPIPPDTLGNRTPVCSGDTATASVIVRAANTAVIPNRQVRFDVVFGNFKFVTDASGANASNTVTLITDQNGRATTLLKTDDGVVSQAAVIRVTDLVTGNRVDTAFTIVQSINGTVVLSVVPSSYTGTAFFKGTCGGTTGDFLVYGGRPPYTVRSSLPGSVRLSVGGIFGDPVTVPAAGGSFRASTAFGTCVGYKASIVITDAAGLNTTVTYEEKEGSEEPPAPPPPTALVITPKAVGLNCTAAPPFRTVNFAIVGGTPPYVLRTSRPAATTVTGTTVTLGTATETIGAAPNNVVDVEVTDSESKQATAKITCL
ncbi:MAG: hypothetical protein ACRDAM_16420 [Casimicrobium sp.]